MLTLFHNIVDSLCMVAAGILIFQALLDALKGHHLRLHYDPTWDYLKAVFKLALAIAAYTAFWKPWS